MKVFIDGKSGTTGLLIYDRLKTREDVELLTIPYENRRDTQWRKKMLNSCDVAFLCLPDEGAREAVNMVENPDVVVIDTSTAHRLNFAYGFAELSNEHRIKIQNSKRIAVPGCHASGFIALIYPLVESGLLSQDALLTCISLTGYSGGGKNMIADYELEDRSCLLDSPRQYALGQKHKHLPEMQAYTGLKNAPIFCSIVADYLRGMEVTVPIFKSQIKGNMDDIKNIYKQYTGLVKYVDDMSVNGFIASNAMSGFDNMFISVDGNEDRILLTALYDNLGKGASGAAIQCMNIAFGLPDNIGLNIGGLYENN